MNVNKRNNYQLTGSIHTLSLISLPVTDIDESISPCFDTLSSRENLSYSKINANKLVGDLFSYDEFKTAFDTILGGAGIESYSLSRFDMRFDSFDPEHYRDYAKLNRYLISALAVTYNVQNCYNDTEIYRKEVHEQFPALYPDDIENISNMSEEKSYLCCQIQATILQRMRSSTPIDTSCWCTCPKKESQN